MLNEINLISIPPPTRSSFRIIIYLPRRRRIIIYARRVTAAVEPKVDVFAIMAYRQSGFVVNACRSNDTLRANIKRNLPPPPEIVLFSYNIFHDNQVYGHTCCALCTRFVFSDTIILY